MSRLFGPVRQIGFVVRNLDAALHYWTHTLGVGPFFIIRHLPIDQFWYHGALSPPPDITLALASSGDLQVELIHQNDERPSAFLDRLRVAGDGLQHLAAWADKTGYDREVARLKASGVPPAHEGWISGAGPRFAFFATDETPDGIQFEIADVADPSFSSMGETIRAAGVAWDGSDPIRDLRI